MKHFDHMIKYLSGDLSPEESAIFEGDLEENIQLKEEFSRVSAAYNMIGDQLRRRDEEAFSSALKAAINKSIGDTPRNKRPGRRWYLLIGVAASLAILVSIFLPGPDAEQIYAKWYRPSEDGVIRTILEGTRGEADTDVAWLWQKGEFESCRKLCSKKLSKDPENQYTMLFCLLSFMEMEEAEPLPHWLSEMDSSSGTPLGQAITWYQSLALVKAGKNTEAVQLLKALEELPGPYAQDAHKLKKKLTK